MCIYVAVVVLVDNGLRGGIDLTVQQEMDCAQGQRMGTISAARQRACSKDEARQGEAKPGGGNAIVVRISAFMADQ